MVMNKVQILKSRLQSLISLYASERDQAVADFNLVVLEEFKEGQNITLKLRILMDKIIHANKGILETQEMWARMNVTDEFKENTETKIEN